MAPILTVIGATGAQGSSVVDHALKAGTYRVRAVTRNPNGEKAKALSAKGVEVVQADVNDEESLVKAFSVRFPSLPYILQPPSNTLDQGSTAIYAVTDFFEPFAKGGPENGMKVEVQQGKNLANAAAKTSTLEHYIWSTLPNGKQISKGKYLVPHFEAKNRIDDYIKANKELYAKTTFLWITFYAANYGFPMYTPIYVVSTPAYSVLILVESLGLRQNANENGQKPSGKYIQTQPAPPTVPLYSMGDAVKNVGVFTNAILAQPKLTLPSKIVLAYAEETTNGGLLQSWSEGTGKESLYVEVKGEAWDKLWPMWGHEMGVMMEFWNAAQDKSWSSDDQEVVTKKELGIADRELVGSKEAFAAMDWSLLL
jgi:hypothetical protein